MEADAEKVCDFTTQTTEMMPEIMQLSIKSAFGGDEESKDAAKKQLDDLENKLESMVEEIAIIKIKYDEEEFEAYLLDNCESAKKLLEMGLALQELGDSIDEN